MLQLLDEHLHGPAWKALLPQPPQGTVCQSQQEVEGHQPHTLLASLPSRRSMLQRQAEIFMNFPDCGLHQAFRPLTANTEGVTLQWSPCSWWVAVSWMDLTFPQLLLYDITARTETSIHLPLRGPDRVCSWTGSTPLLLIIMTEHRPRGLSRGFKFLPRVFKPSGFSASHYLMCIDPSTGEQVVRIIERQASAPRQAQFAVPVCGKVIAAAYEPGLIDLIQLPALGTLCQKAHVHDSSGPTFPRSMSFSPNRELLAVAWSSQQVPCRRQLAVYAATLADSKQHGNLEGSRLDIGSVVHTWMGPAQVTRPSVAESSTSHEQACMAFAHWEWHPSSTSILVLDGDVLNFLAMPSNVLLKRLPLAVKRSFDSHHPLWAWWPGTGRLLVRLRKGDDVAEDASGDDVHIALVSSEGELLWEYLDSRIIGGCWSPIILHQPVFAGASELRNASLSGLVPSLESLGVHFAIMAGHTARCEVALFLDTERAESECETWTEGLEQRDITQDLASLMAVLACVYSETTIRFPCRVREDSQVAWHPSPALGHVFAAESAKGELLLMDACANISLMKGWSAWEIRSSHGSALPGNFHPAPAQYARFLQKNAWSPDGSSLFLAGIGVVKSIRFDGDRNVPGGRSAGCAEMGSVSVALNRKALRSRRLLANVPRVLRPS